MLIAVTSSDGKHIDTHFGKADRFLVYEVGTGEPALRYEVQVPRYCGGTGPGHGLMPDKLAAISEVRQTKEGISFKLHDKKGALDSVAKVLGIFTEKREHTGPGGGPIQMAVSLTAGMSEAEIAAELEGLEAEPDEADYELPEITD